MEKLYPESEQAANLLLDKIRTDPVFFFEEVLGAKIDAQQKEIVEAFPHHRRMAIKSGHSNGKDFLAARLALWFHLVYPDSIVVVTGPTDRQVRQIVFGELKAAHRLARYEVGGEMLETMLKSGDSKHYIIGFTASSPDSFQGIHAPNLLVIVTEATGIEPRMWPAIFSLLTSIGEAKFLAIGNALFEPDSEFYAMFTRNAQLYKTFTMNSERSEYCSKKWIEEILHDCSGDKGSPLYQARVLGVFPEDVTDTLIPLVWIERAMERYGRATTDTSGVVALGCDVARFGSDLSVTYRGDGDQFKCVRAVQGADLMATTGTLVRDINEGVPAGNVRVDDTGVGGGVTDRLMELGHRVQAINFGSNSSDQEKYANARSELFWCLRERFREGRIAIHPTDKKLLRDLSVLRYKMTSKGQIKLEAKDEAKRRLGYSPDHADALALAALPGAIADAVAAKGKPNWGLLEYMRARSLQITKDNVSSLKNATSVRDVRDIPGGAAMLQQPGATDGGNKLLQQARQIGL